MSACRRQSVRPRVLAVLAAGAVLAGCGTAEDRDQARAAAERLYAAVEADDGAGACRQLSPDTRTELESQEQSACEKAVLELDLQTAGARAERTEVFTNEAAVHLSGGDTVFLDETQEGWRVSALGCRDQQTNSPADCEVQA
jgi:hypothetical protein